MYALFAALVVVPTSFLRLLCLRYGMAEISPVVAFAISNQNGHRAGVVSLAESFVEMQDDAQS
jgi:hypothetical protein